MNDVLKKTVDKFHELIELEKSNVIAANLIHWDMSTGGSEKGMDYRSKMIGIYTVKAFEILTSDEMKECLEVLEKNLDELDDVHKRMYIMYKKEYDKNIKIPKEEARAYAELEAKSQMLWEKAKHSKDYGMFKDTLGEVIGYQKKFVEYRGFEGHPYNTLLDDFEEGMTIEIMDEYFENLKAAIVPLVKKISESSLDYNIEFLDRDFPIDKQKEFCKELLTDIGFDYKAGMVKESVHPFTMGINIGDVRLTIKYVKDALSTAIFSAAHEGGHAIYEQNIDPKLELTGLDTGVSSGIHESQSRLYENILCRSKAFWSSYYDKLKSYFPEQLSDTTLDDFYAGINKVENSFIRIEADELTYSLHIIIRYEIEKAIMSNEVTVEELPALWNKKVKEYLGLDVTDDEMGVLQDVHWSAGLFGYFPTYSLGSAYASQFAHSLGKVVDIEGDLEKCDFSNINKWLKDNIHTYGSLLTPEQIMVKATGEKFDSKYYIDYLSNKYKELYKIED